MTDRLARYRAADTPLPDRYDLWPLYGTGFENLGLDGGTIRRPLPDPGPEELLVRHDAVGICFSDIKVMRTGQNHPRIYRKMSQDPVVLGHEVSLTVVKVGADLREQYAVGQRFIVQADIYIDGVSYAYGYELQGGYAHYNIVDWRVLDGDDGNYLLPVQPETGYAEAALNEPWACVEAAFSPVYRTTWQPGGTVLLRGDGAGVSLGEAANWRPARLVLDVTDPALEDEVKAWAAATGVVLIEDDGALSFDDVVILGVDPDRIEADFARLARGGVFNVVSPRPIPRRVALDIGRIHYDHLAVIGTTSADMSAAYTPIRTQLKPGGDTWILGAAGPMGHMHIQRALELAGRPGRLVATNRNAARMAPTQAKFAPLAQSVGVDLHCLSEDQFAQGKMDAALAHLAPDGFDDIVVMAPSTAAIEEAMTQLAEGGVMNVFAGLPRGTLAAFDYNLITQRGARFVGTSGSSIADLRHMLDLTESHTLSTNSAVAAVAGLAGVPAGLRAVADGRFAGKVVIYPHLDDLPLTSLEELAHSLPTVFAQLKDGRIWTNEAEAELMRLKLKA